jgi:hypothetical protein
VISNQQLKSLLSLEPPSLLLVKLEKLFQMLILVTDLVAAQVGE